MCAAGLPAYIYLDKSINAFKTLLTPICQVAERIARSNEVSPKLHLNINMMANKFNDLKKGFGDKMACDMVARMPQVGGRAVAARCLKLAGRSVIPYLLQYCRKSL